MTMDDPNRLDFQQARQLLETHGANPAHWPEACRVHLSAMVQKETALQKLAEREHLLDALLLELVRESPPSRLRRHILALGALPPATPWWWPFGPLWRPAAVLAMSALLGLGMGLWWSPTALQEEVTREDAMQMIQGQWEDDHDQ